jgi:hypothetical protein
LSTAGLGAAVGVACPLGEEAALDLLARADGEASVSGVMIWDIWG